MGNDLRVLWFKGIDAESKQVTISAVTGVPRLFAGQLIYPKFAEGRAEPWCLDLESGRERKLSVSLNPVLIATSSDKVAILGLTPDGTPSFAAGDSGLNFNAPRPVPALSKEGIIGGSLIWLGPSRLALVDLHAAAYSILSPESGDVLSAVTLRGSEIDLSRTVLQRNQAGVLKGSIVRSYMGSKGSGDLFLLGPFKRAEGYRLAAFDANGNQQSSYVLTTDGAFAAFADQTAAYDDTLLEVVAMDGTRRLFRRP